ncbi:MAG TPA: hypothetical protein VNC78_05670 [Actinomycetota bacterium]|nr:hypothetical protein [Actinomycetota bacterium]
MRARRAGALIAVVALASLLIPMGRALACASHGPTCGIAALLKWDKPYFKTGEVASGRTSVRWPGKPSNHGPGRPEDGPYVAYLRPMKQLRGLPHKDPNSIRLGLLDIDPSGRAEGLVSLEFVVPAVRGGKYLVEMCNENCQTRLGDLQSTPIEIVTDEIGERWLVSSKIDDLEGDVINTKGKLNVAIHRSKRALDRQEKAMDYAVEDLEDEIAELNAEVTRLRNRKPSEPQGLNSFAIGGLALALWLAVVRFGRPLRERGLPAPSH